MKYVKLTWDYIKEKHFRILALACVVPAVALALLKSFSTTASYFVNFSRETSDSFAEIFRLSTRFGWQSVLRGVASIVIIALFSSYLVGVVIRHMRTGRPDLSHAFTRINENFLAVIRLVLLTGVLILLFGLLNSTFVFLWSKVARNVIWLVFLLSFLTMAGLFFILIGAFSYTALWVPAMVVTGQPALPSLATSIRETKDHGFASFFVGVLLPLIPGFAIEFLTSFVGNPVLTVIGDFVFYFVVLAYYPVFSAVAYYDVNGLDREDLLRANRM